MKKSEAIKNNKEYYKHTENKGHLQAQIMFPARRVEIKKNKRSKYACRNNKARCKDGEFYFCSIVIKNRPDKTSDG